MKIIYSLFAEKGGRRRRRLIAGVDHAEVDRADEGGPRPVDRDAAQEGPRTRRRGHGQEQRGPRSARDRSRRTSSRTRQLASPLGAGL